ncbi:hypothetical protein GQX74_011394 [Glossina fuscipes]|nr:hypothetical protein GQX74_011394 [Glossina fuscipes]
MPEERYYPRDIDEMEFESDEEEEEQQGVGRRVQPRVDRRPSNSRDYENGDAFEEEEEDEFEMEDYKSSSDDSIKRRSLEISQERHKMDKEKHKMNKDRHGMHLLTEPLNITEYWLQISAVKLHPGHGEWYSIEYFREVDRGLFSGTELEMLTFSSSLVSHRNDFKDDKSVLVYLELP